MRSITKKLLICLVVYNFYVTFAASIKCQRIVSNMKTSELLRCLRDAGCVMARHGGGHDKWVNPKTGAVEWVPRHAGEVPNGLAQKILKKLTGG